MRAVASFIVLGGGLYGVARGATLLADARKDWILSLGGNGLLGVGLLWAIGLTCAFRSVLALVDVIRGEDKP